MGISLANKLPSTNYSFKSFLKPVIKETSPTRKNELYEICRMFEEGKAPGIHNIPMHIVKNHLLYFRTTHAYNQYVYGKRNIIAKIIPIFKSRDVDKFSNYRPTSIMTSFSKFFEKV